MANSKIIELDGRTGEGGGQLVRVAVSLSALTLIPVRIVNVRGNRRGNRGGSKEGGGLKAQHVSSITWLQKATSADVRGNSVGSKILTFIPTRPCTALLNRNIVIKADTASSTLLVFQALFPFLLFASTSTEISSPITLTIQGGTNVSYSLSYEYLDQVLLPTLLAFGLRPVSRRLISRGWSHGSKAIGTMEIIFIPLSIGKSLCLNASAWPICSTAVRKDGLVNHPAKIDISLIVPAALQQLLKDALNFELGLVFPDVETAVIVDEDSHHSARCYILLVAHVAPDVKSLPAFENVGNMAHTLKFGRDYLYDKSTKSGNWGVIALQMAQRVVDELDTELRKGGVVDEFLDDQLSVFRALAEGRSTAFAADNGEGDNSSDGNDELIMDKMHDIKGEGSMHAKTARWVISEMIPAVRWYNGGRVCDGIGFKIEDTRGPLQDSAEQLASSGKR